MKQLTTLTAILVSFFSISQNIVYFERLNDISNFHNGTGQIQVHSVGVSPDVHVKISYNKLISGNSVPTGWIDLSSSLLTDVGDTLIEAIGIYSQTGDTVIDTKQLITSPLYGYEISDITTQGFGTSDAKQIKITFVGPDNNCDALFFSGLQHNIKTVNNVLTIDENYSLFGSTLNDLIYFNGYDFYNSFIIGDLAKIFPIKYPELTSDKLNAYIPRIVHRPETINSCNGIVHFERVSLVSDIALSYSINNDVFTSFSNDTIKGVCANDTIKVIGFSSTILANDTLVETIYVLKSQLDTNAVKFDLSRVEIILNEGEQAYGCENKIKFRNKNKLNYQSGYGLITNSKKHKMEVDVPVFPNPIGISCDDVYFNQCQDKYSFFAYDNLDDYPISRFSYTILDVKNQIHRDSFTLNFEIQNKINTPCSINLQLKDSIQEDPFYCLSTYKLEPDNSGGTTITQLGNSEEYFKDSVVVENLCKSLGVLSDHKNFSRIVVLTDSLIQLKTHYEKIEVTRGGTVYGTTLEHSGNIFVPTVDTIIHYYQECTTDYTQPISNVDFKGLLKNQLEFGAVSFINYDFSVSFSQNNKNISLPARDVFVPVVYMTASNAGSEFDEYIIAELYCKEKSSGVKRRRIVQGLDGKIHDVFTDNSLGIQEIEVSNFKLFPNPSNEKITISLGNEMSQISIIDFNGTQLFNEKVIGNTVNIDVAFLAKGAYIIEVKSDENIVRSHFVKM